MKKVLILIMVSLLALLPLSVHASAIDLTSMTSEELTNLQNAIDAEIASRNPVETTLPEGILAEGDLGDYHIAIVGAELSKDYKDNDCLVVIVDWSHNSTDAESFLWSFTYKAFQNGVECDNGMMVDGIDSNETSREIKAGVTRQVKIGFVIEDTVSPVEVEISEMLAFTDEKVVYTFDLPL